MGHSKDPLRVPLLTIECGTPREAVGGRKAPSGLAMTGQVLVAAPECGCFGEKDQEEPYSQLQLQSPDAHRHTDTPRSMLIPSPQPHKHWCVSVCLNQSCSLRDNMQTQDFPTATKLAGICLLLLHPELSTDQEGDRRHSIDLGVSSARLKANSAPAVWHHLGAMLFSSRTYGLAMKTRDSGVYSTM